MKTLLASIITFFVVLSGGAVYANNTGTGIGVTGETRWLPEYHQALDIMQQYGIPIHDGCGAGDVCVRMSHYSAKDGNAGYSVMAGNSGSVIRLNDFYDNSNRWYRVHLIIHEAGHQAGLKHSSRCDTAMNPTIPACGKYTLGYNESELRQIQRTWR